MIITARQSLIPTYDSILTNLVKIIEEISKNPSNPKFNQYCFESVSALIRLVKSSLDDFDFSDGNSGSSARESLTRCWSLRTPFSSPLKTLS